MESEPALSGPLYIKILVRTGEMAFCTATNRPLAFRWKLSTCPPKGKLTCLPINARICRCGNHPRSRDPNHIAQHAGRIPKRTAALSDWIKNPDIFDDETVTTSVQPAFKNRKTSRKPEILAPAGGWPQLRAAVKGGADAVYFGLEALNARARASNFTVEELPDIIGYLHERGVRGFVAVNVLVFDEELAQAETLVRAVARAGVDAVIVQDVGLVSLIKRFAPSLKVHGSTQMSITSAEGAEFARELGCERVVVGRELSIRDIAAVREGTTAEVEAFVHGALCVSYSGQCFSSEAWGGRSANRGQCAQACRLPYGLVVDGTMKDMGDVKYLLSPQDLMAVELVPQLIDAGVGCFKIEGRLKGPEYVGLTTSVYRRAVDEAWEARFCESGDSYTLSEPEWSLSDADRIDLAQVFARGQDDSYDGLMRGFLEGPNHQRLVRGRSPRRRGVFLGKVVKSFIRRGGGVVVHLNGKTSVKRGDGVVFDRGMPDKPEAGGSVWEVLDSNGESIARSASEAVSVGEYELTFAAATVNMWANEQGGAREPKPGDLVWRSSDPAFEARLRKMYGEDVDHRSTWTKEPVVIHMTSKGIGSPLRISIVDADGRKGVGITRSFLSVAERRPLTFASLATAVGQLGDTHFNIGELNIENIQGMNKSPGLFITMGEVKAARREAVDALMSLRKAYCIAEAHNNTGSPTLERSNEQSWWGDHATGPGTQMIQTNAALVNSSDNEDQLSVLCRTRAQAEAAMNIPWLNEIILDFLEVHGLQDVVNLVKASGRNVVVATPRVLKPNEERLWRFYLRLGADALLVRSAGFMRILKNLRENCEDLCIPELRGDFSLNAANAVGASVLFRHGGLDRLTPTHDLNAVQQVNMARALGAEGAAKLEVIVHQHLPIFYTEHCVFCRFLSEGNSHKDCGHPCETTRVHLRDGEGSDHLVLADMGCRNTVFNAKAQSGAEYIHELTSAGITRFRVELVDEPAEIVSPLLEAYKDCLLGLKKGRDVVELVGSFPDANGRSHGAGRGSFEVKKEIDRTSMKSTAAARNAAYMPARSVHEGSNNV